MRGVKFIEKSSQEFMDLLGLEEALDRIPKANGVRWYGQILEKDSDVLRVLDFVLVGRRVRG